MSNYKHTPGKPLYLDFNATTPMDPRVFEVLKHFSLLEFGNAGSRTHAYGTEAKKAITVAREQISKSCSSNPDEVIFTSGATESNNLAILGLADHGIRTGRRHIITSPIEHKAVLEPIAHLEEKGFQVDYLPVGKNGKVIETELKSLLRKDTLLVSVMHVNNETGVTQPVSEICKTLETHEAFLHVDAAQSFGKLGETLRNKRIDMISLSGHKLFAPKGIGALIARVRGYDKLPLTPLMFGGGQERGLRPGTLPVASIAALGEAVELVAASYSKEWGRLSETNQIFRNSLLDAGVRFNGDQSLCVPWTVNFYMPGKDSEALIVALKNIASLSNGSACTSHLYSYSHVLLAMGLSKEETSESIRVSWGLNTKAEDLLQLSSALKELAD